MNSYTRHSFGSLNLLEDITPLDYQPAHRVFDSVRTLSDHHFLLESKDISHIYGRLSLIGIDPVLKIVAKDNHFSIDILNERGDKFLHHVQGDLENICDRYELSIEGCAGDILTQRSDDVEAAARIQQESVLQVIRYFLKHFVSDKKSFLGLYGAFAYDMVRLLESIPSLLPETDVPDFTLCLFDTFIYFDHLKERSELILLRSMDESVQADTKEILSTIDSEECEHEFSITDPQFHLEKEEYEAKVEQARELARKGELFEVVFSNELTADFSGDPFGLYLKYREVNPSPYLFYFNFDSEQLVGASPEMMVRCENRQVHIRPISGTAPRGKDPIEDHENMLALLNSEKERAELDMLIDLGRNDLSRICKPGISVSDYRFVEKYSRVMHTVAHVSGELEDHFIAFDALLACAYHGTLTGAPKVAAMIEIEKHEKSRRGYYGGAVGYLTFSGDMDTGIIIRTAHIRNGKLTYRSGATLLYDSDPEKEYFETIHKAQAFLDTFRESSAHLSIS